MAKRRTGGGRGRDADLEQRWRRRVAAWEASGLTARAFCRARGLGENSFYAWRREIRRRDAEAASRRPTNGTAPARLPSASAQRANSRKPPRFVAVNLPATPVSASPVEIVLPEGACVRVSREADVATIIAALRALEEARSC